MQGFFFHFLSPQQIFLTGFLLVLLLLL